MNDEKRRQWLWLAGRDHGNRAVVIDFEGFKSQSPSLCGVLVDGTYTLCCFEPELNLAWNSAHMDRDSFVDLLNSYVSEGRAIVAYSQYEQLVLDSHFGDDHGIDVINIKIGLEYWWHRKRSVTPAPSTLNDFVKLVTGQCIPRKGNMTNMLRAVLQVFPTVKRFGKLDAQTKQTWYSLVNYNRADCFAVRRLMVRASNAAAKRRHIAK
jgi:hypothetical protein